MIDETHDPARPCWVATAAGHREFPIQNLPLGIFSDRHAKRRAGMAIGDFIFDLWGACAAGLLDGFDREVLAAPTLNPLLASREESRLALRRMVSTVLSDARYKEEAQPLLVNAAEAVLHRPASVGDYSDFYAGIHHAENVGKLFRPDAPLLANYKYIPVGYHGRASSIRVSGMPVRRPKGQLKGQSPDPRFDVSRRLDFELELGIWIGSGHELGKPIAIRDAQKHIAGFCLLNDWSARDLQAWEYQPLGPFLAKSFLTTISPWIVTLEALAPFRIPQPSRPQGDPRPLDYLWDEDDQQNGAYAIELEAHLATARMREAGEPPCRISRTAARHLYWTAAQLVTHHASNGCNLCPGDLLGTGTISGPAPGSLGSLLEITRGGQDPLALPNGEQRTFLEDGDEVNFSAHAQREGAVTIGFGPCNGMVVGQASDQCAF